MPGIYFFRRGACRKLLLTLALLMNANGASAGHFKILHAFTGGSDGEAPYAGVASDGKGNLYGTTFGSPHSEDPGKLCSKGCGNAYAIVQGGGEQPIHEFNYKHGAFPFAPLLAVNGKLYGTTSGGGAGRCQHENGTTGCGTVFELSPKGAERLLYSFCSNIKITTACTDGDSPDAALIVDGTGNFFGTTQFGGAQGFGVVFELSSSGSEKVLYSFCSKPNCVDGQVPSAGVVADRAGNLYGTTYYGGSRSAGVVFQIANSGAEAVLHSFCSRPNCADGAFPEAALLRDSAGTLYGTTTSGGGTSCFSTGCGVVFRLTTDGKYDVLYAFKGGTDGDSPQSALIRDGSGNLYGTTEFGAGTGCSLGDGCGTVFKLSADGSETLLHAFSGGKDGGLPFGSVALLGGYLFGTTVEGGALDCGHHHRGCGVVFQLMK